MMTISMTASTSSTMPSKSISVNLADGGMSTVGYDKENNSFWKIKNDYAHELR